jgi:twitching motility protein PilT
MVEHINRNHRCHIVTIEDPIEYIFEDKMSTISQREVGVDATTMQVALRGALRQDPDVIMVGEMRDFSTMQTAITAAETGHLVVSTLHTSTASQALDRIIDSFPADAKNQLRLQLANSLLGVITQRLVRKADGTGRTIACEVLLKSPTIEKCILENRLVDIESVMESSNLYYKMQSMNQALEILVRNGVVTMEEALMHSDKREDLTLKLSGMTMQSQGSVEASDLLNQAKESTQLTIREGSEDGETEERESSLAMDPAANPNSSGLKLDTSPEDHQRKLAGAVKGFSNLFKKKGA